jgi:hypothetical protein
MDSKHAFTLDSEMNPKQSQSNEPPSHDGELHEGSVEKPSGVSGFALWLRRLSVETGGIQRVTDEERAQSSSKVWNACTFW